MSRTENWHYIKWFIGPIFPKDISGKPIFKETAMKLKEGEGAFKSDEIQFRKKTGIDEFFDPRTGKRVFGIYDPEKGYIRQDEL